MRLSMSAGEPRKVGTRWWTDLGCRLWMDSTPTWLWDDFMWGIYE